MARSPIGTGTRSKHSRRLVAAAGAARAAPPATPSQRSQRSRERILASAARCFSDLGFHRTRLQDVAGGAGVSRGLVYAYFESKENLLREVRDAELTGWRAAVEPRIEAAETACARLEAMVLSTLRYARARPFLQAILAEDSRIVVLGRDRVSREAIALWRDRLVALLDAGVASGELRADLDVGHSADALRAMVMGIVDRMHRRDPPIDVSSHAHDTAAVELILRGVRA